MSDTFYGSWDIYAVTVSGGNSASSTNLSGVTITVAPAAELTTDDAIGVDQGGTSVTSNSDTVSDSQSNFAGYPYNGEVTISITGGGTATGFLFNDGGSPATSAVFYLAVTPNVDLAPGGVNTNFTDNANSWNLTLCFLAGTRIATPDGERAVETLAAGDMVLTADGTAKPVRWLGRSTRSRVFGDQTRVLPIRIKAGALGENLPVRDLLVSPGHAVRIGDALVNASALVNGASVVRETDIADRFTYFHVELDGHDLLVAEGVAAESFLVGGEDMSFDNLADRPAAAGEQPEMAYPRVKSYRQMPASMRALLAARAAVIAPDVQIAA